MCSLQFILLENALKKTSSTFCNSNFSNCQPKISYNVFFSNPPQKPIKKPLGETTLTPSFLLPASEEAVSQSDEKSSMASVTNLKLRDGVGTVVPVEAFPKGFAVSFRPKKWMASFKGVSIAG